MKARKLILKYKHGNKEEWITFTEVEGLMQEYAKLKCQELLDILVEKAKVKNTLYYMDKDNIDTAFEFYSELDGRFEVDRDSIVNAVDLDSFIV